MVGNGFLCRLALVVVVVSGASTSFATAGNTHGTARAHPISAAPLGGVNIAGLEYSSSPAQADEEISAASSLHALVVRVQIPWSVLEPRKSEPVDPKALAFVDRLVGDASAHGIKVITTVDSTPCWASSAPASLLGSCLPGQFGKANAWPPRDPSSIDPVVGFLATRYGPRLAAIEIWNEPDQANQEYFAGPNKVRRYAAVLRAAYPAIKRANPNIPVLGGSLVGSNGDFLRGLYAAGIKGYYDGLAVHFYTLTLGSLRTIHEVQLANGDRTPLWLDEFGWSSCWPRRTQEEQACVTRQIQGTNLANIFRSLVRTPFVAATVMYDLQESTSENFGVLTRRGARKPAFVLLSKVLAWPFGQPSPVALRLRTQDGVVIASGSGPVGDYMQLEAFQGSLLRYRALFTLDRFNHYSIKLPKALGTSGLQVRVYQYWAGPNRAALQSI
jgi:hypothetical protein